MVAPNAIQYDDIDEDWYCRPCERHFVSAKAIHAHCRNAAVHLDEWCERCEWLFISQSARIDHRHNSRHHNVCPNCQVDFLSRAVLDDHMEETHFYCQRCKSYVKDRRGSKNQALWRLHQIETHFMCAKCDTYFENQNNVDQHQQVHIPRDKECYGCYRKFQTLSGMMIHLESGTCSSQVTTKDIDTWAWKHRPLHRHMEVQASSRYGCPGCEHRFSYLSGLLQHLESNSCGATIEANLRNLPTFLKNKVSQIQNGLSA